MLAWLFLISEMLAKEVPHKYTAVNILIITGVLHRTFFMPSVYSFCK